jgi:uncharacterized protein GlcG (DUF336 family)
MKSRKTILGTTCLAALLFSSSPAFGQEIGCGNLPTHAQLVAALKTATGIPPAGNGGFSLHMWATVVNRDGVVCGVAFTGPERGDQWPGSRVISAQKANTANAFSLPGLALSTANLFTAVQPGGSLFGLQHSNPVHTENAYAGPSANYGKDNDPLVNKKIGGINVFGGGLALYNGSGQLVGGLGVSGDSSCADHNIAWKTRHALGLNRVPGGVSATGDDNIVYPHHSSSPKKNALFNAWGHPECSAAATAIGNGLPASHPIP